MQKLDKKRLFLSLAVVFAVCALLIAHHIVWRSTGIGIPCLFNKLFGIKCAGCGMTRAMFALFSLDIKGAHEYNLLILPMLAYIVWFVGRIIHRFARHKESPFDVKPYAVHFVMAALLLIYGVLRNISF